MYKVYRQQCAADSHVVFSSVNMQYGDVLWLRDLFVCVCVCVLLDVIYNMANDVVL